MINIKNVCVALLVLLMHVMSCNAQEGFETRLSQVKSQLEMLSDSLAPGLNEYATLSVANSSIQSFMRTLAEGHELNVQIDPSLNITLTNNFTNVQVKDLLYFLCREYKLDIRFVNSILSFYQFREPVKVILPPPVKKLDVSYDNSSSRITFDLSNDTLKSFVKLVTSLTNRNVIASGGSNIENKIVQGYIKDLPLENALDKFAFINGLKFSKTKDGVFVFENIQPIQQNFNSNVVQNSSFSPQRQSQGEITARDSLLDLDVINIPLLEIVNQASLQLNKNYFVFSEITGSTTAKVRGVTYEELLSILFQGTNYTYKKRENFYMIGQRMQEGFRTTELYKLDFRPIDGIDKELPADLVKDIEVRIARELNSVILTGNKHRIDELISFLKLIDQPVPNILIEVIVAEAKKGFSLQTGLKAFLADSVPSTQGQVFPGIDLTLSTKSINNVLDKLDSKGIVNLGRVSPKFYMTLQAMEKNNNLQLRSTPKLSTINGSKANLTIGQSVYYVEQTQNITGGVTPITTTSQRFNKVEANLSISISPVVSGNEHITLDILAEFSNFIPSTIANAPPGNTTRKFESKIRVRNEEMIILGGLEELTKSETGSGVPILSRIPVLKWLFSSKTKEKSDSQLIVFIKPTIVY
jgi:type IV pilus assembly protein PilQ